MPTQDLRRLISAAQSAGVALAIACLPSMAVALEFYCEFTQTSGATLAASEHVVIGIEGEAYRGSTGTCVNDVRVLTTLKGPIEGGAVITKPVHLIEDCSTWSPSRKPSVFAMYMGDDGLLDEWMCAGVGRDVADAFLRQRTALEQAAAQSPDNLDRQINLATFFVDWADNTRAEPVIAHLVATAPEDPRVQFLEARHILQSRRRGDPAKLRALDALKRLAADDAVARLAYETNAAGLALADLAGPDGRIPDDAVRPHRRIAELDVSGRNLTGQTLGFVEIDRLKASRSDWTAGYLGDLDLSSADFRDAIFTEAVLTGSNFKGADLRRAKLAGALFTGADFSGAQMALANLRGAYSSNVKFVGTDLRGATLSGELKDTDFSRADLRGTDLRELLHEGARWTGARYDCGTRLPAKLIPGENGMIADAACDGGVSRK